MMTDVFLCSFSPIPRISNGHLCSAKISLCCDVNFPVIFLFVCFSRECRQISCWDPFVTTPSSSEGEGMEDSIYMAAGAFLRKMLLVHYLWFRHEMLPSFCCEMLRHCVSNVAPGFRVQQLFWVPRYPPNPEALKSPAAFNRIGHHSNVHIYECRAKLGCDMQREWAEVMNEINLKQFLKGFEIFE